MGERYSGKIFPQKKKRSFMGSAYFVRLTGLEPARRGTLDPKSSASTNSATGAKVGAKVRKRVKSEE